VNYTLRIKQSALRSLERLSKPDQTRVDRLLAKLALNERPPGAIPLTGAGKGLWRARAGDWRVVYQIDDANKVVLVVMIAHRREVYRGL
jgi:mRNA interferase RelE/StbE